MNHMNRESAIGVFDSGVGGLTVAREIMALCPNETIVYFGDTARVPYGSKSQDTVTHYAEQIIRFLQTQEVKAIVIACNTASAFAIDTVSAEFDIPIIGVIEPGARTAVEVTRNKKVGVIGTEGTVRSGVHANVIRAMDPEIEVTGVPCPLFVPLVEEGWLRDPVTSEVAARYLRQLQDTGIDTLILGCTHYPLLTDTVQEIMGDRVRLVNPAYETARELQKLLKEHEVEADSAGEHRFFVSDTAQKFASFANSILPYDVEAVKKIRIEEY